MSEDKAYPVAIWSPTESVASAAKPNCKVEIVSPPYLERDLRRKLLQACSPSAAVEIVRQLHQVAAHGGPLLLLLNAVNVRATDQAPRHNSSFASQAFVELKKSIRSTHGNQQPVLIRLTECALEIVFGHRRHTACLDLGLAVLAIVWEGELSEVDAFMCLERENEVRTSLSAYERGRLFRSLLSRRVFCSIRDLAVHIGMSHTGVIALLRIADLHALVVKAFGDPCSITTKHAEKIAKAWKSDETSILARAQTLCNAPPEETRSPRDVLEYLLQTGPELATVFPLVEGRPDLGTWEAASNRHIVVRLPAWTGNKVIADIGDLIQRAEVQHEANDSED